MWGGMRRGERRVRKGTSGLGGERRKSTTAAATGLKSEGLPENHRLGESFCGGLAPSERNGA